MLLCDGHLSSGEARDTPPTWREGGLVEPQTEHYLGYQGSGYGIGDGLMPRGCPRVDFFWPG
jgi:hypothetical protein